MGNALKGAATGLAAEIQGAEAMMATKSHVRNSADVYGCTSCFQLPFQINALQIQY